MATSEELNYFAGIVDGEGTIGLVLSRRASFNPSIAVSNTDARLPIWIQQTFGGHIYFYKQTNPKHKPAVRWVMNGRAAIEVIREVYPYLLLKKEAADQVIMFWDSHEQHNINYGHRASQDFIDSSRVLQEALHIVNKRGGY